MAVLTFQWRGNGIKLLKIAMRHVGSQKGTLAFARALDHTGRKTYTQVRRTLARQVGLPVGKTEQLGRLKKRAIYGSMPEFIIKSTGSPLSLHHFNARETGKGVKARVYSKSTLFRSAFFIPRWNSEVFWRKGDPRFPVERVAGPHIPREMVRYKSREAFQTFVSANLPKRVAHEVRRLTRGVVA